MGTRASIVRENLDGSFDTAYTHWDGYPSHHGPILLEHYSDPAKLDALLALGDMSSLDAEIGDKHDFDKTPDGVCNFYHRDRGEPWKDVKPQHFTNAAELAKMLKEAWTEWVYVFRMADGKWYFTNNPSPTWFKCCGTEQRTTEELTLEACAK